MKRMQLFQSTSVLLLLVLVFAGGCKKTITDQPATTVTEMPGSSWHPSHEKADVAIDWYQLLLKIVLNSSPQYPNPVVLRAIAYSGISLHESVRFLQPHSKSFSVFLYQMPTMPSREANKDYSEIESANAAISFIFRNMLPALSPHSSFLIDSLENVWNGKVMANETQAVFLRSQSFGRAIAQTVLGWALTDNFNHANDPYTIPVFPGAWEKTPPLFANPATPYFGKCRPFLAIDSSGTGHAPLFAYSEDIHSNFYHMVYDIYQVSQNLTTEQSNIALFWNDLGTGIGYTPPGHALSILNQVLIKEHQGLSKAAEAYAKLGMGEWDGSIMCFRAKYTYNLLRPVTYIRRFIDPAWSPLIPTPPHPEFPAAHAYVTSAGMLALAGVIGDHHQIVDHTYDFVPRPSRTYQTLSSIGVESGMSRRFGGIHYLPSILEGIAGGQAVGHRIGAIEVNDEDDDDDGDHNH